MILEIVQYGHPVLRTPGEEVGEITEEIRAYVDDLLETMRFAHGVGLASQQVGKRLQIAVVDVTGIEERPSRMWIDQQPVDPEEFMPIILINPQIKLTKKKTMGMEGCLSIPGVYAEVNRSQRVGVVTQTLDGGEFRFEAAGLLGRAVQHEVDHLHGRLFIDLMSPEERKAHADQLELIRQGKVIPDFLKEPEEDPAVDE